MKRFLQNLLAIALFLSMTLVTTTIHAQTKLTWKLKAGETLHYVSTAKITMDLGGKKTTDEMEAITNMTWKVNKINEDGSFDITQTIDRIRFNIEMGSLKKEIKLDSASKKEERNMALGMVKETIKPMIGEKISMTVAANGTPRDIKIPEKITKAMIELPFMKEIFSGKGIGAAGGGLPDKPVKAGESWKKEIKIEMPFGKMNNKYAYTYKGQNKDRFEEIALQLDIDFMPKENAQIQIEMKVKESQGTILFDNKKGRIHSSDLTFVVENKIKTGGKTINQTMTTTATFKLVDPQTKDKKETESKP